MGYNHNFEENLSTLHHEEHTIANPFGLFEDKNAPSLTDSKKVALAQSAE